MAVDLAVGDKAGVLNTPRQGKDVLWPSLADPYKAAANPADSEIPRLVVVLGRDGFKPGATAYHILQYVHIDDGEAGFTAGGEQWFSFLFVSKEPKLLKVFGSSILRIGDYISLHRMPWIRVADRDFRAVGGSAGEVITRIEITPWEPVQE